MFIKCVSSLRKKKKTFGISIFDSSYIDFIIKGEGEETFLEVCNKLSQNQNIFDIQGLAYAKDGEIISNPDR